MSGADTIISGSKIVVGTKKLRIDWKTAINQLAVVSWQSAEKAQRFADLLTTDH
ncbi:MAG: hypothetical protein H0X15_00980 [Acidobacteria bacterium]|nr:hypothetical protein [Acidobacteriota bacterium]